MYSLGSRRSCGASDGRIMYPSSSRCIRNGTQASPLSTQIGLSLGKRSGMPVRIQLVAWIMFDQTKHSACMPRKRLMVASEGSSQWYPARQRLAALLDHRIEPHVVVVVYRLVAGA